MSQEKKSAKTEEKSGGGGKKVAIIIIILLLLGANGFLIFNKVKTDKEHVEALSGKDALIAQREASIDSLHTELQIRFDKILALEGDTTALGEAMREIEAEKKKLRRSTNIAWGKVKGLEKIKNKYELMLKQQDQELLSLRSASDSLNKWNAELKETIVVKDGEITTLSSENEELTGQVELAKVLSADKFAFSYIDKKENLKQWEEIGTPTFKAKKVVKIRTDFKLMPNRVALVEDKEVFMQLKDPSGNTIYDLSLGSGEFELEGSQEYYTLKQNTLYDTRGKQVTFIYEKGSPFIPGKYSVSIYCEGQKIGGSSFNLK